MIERRETPYKLYDLFIGLTVTVMITCDTLVYKVFDVAGFKITASGMIFSFCYLMSTIVTETYGYKKSGRMVWIMVACQTVYVGFINIASIIQPDSNKISEGYQILFSHFWQVMIGTWISVPASYFCNGWIVSKLKVFFHGRFFIARYILSSMIAQAVLLMTAYPISLSSKYSASDLVNIISFTWAYKVSISILLLPAGVYLAGLVKKFERTDYYDLGVSYNPFIVFKNESNEQSKNLYQETKYEVNSNK